MINVLFALSVAAGETPKDIRGKLTEVMPASTEHYTLKGNLLKIEEGVWLLEDRFGNQHRLQIEAETRLPLLRKQRGDSVHAVINTDGHARIIH